MKKNNKPTISDAMEWVNKGLVTNKQDIDWIKNNSNAGIKDKPKKALKYKNKKVFYNNIWFDSIKECERYKELKLLEKLGEITNLRLQARYEIIPKTETTRASYYKADFVYLHLESRSEIVEDVKSEITRKLPTYILKKKLMKSIHDIDIVEI